MAGFQMEEKLETPMRKKPKKPKAPRNVDEYIAMEGLVGTQMARNFLIDLRV